MNYWIVLLVSTLNFNLIRKYIIVLGFLLVALKYLWNRRKNKKKRPNEDEIINQYFEKNEDGYYPWEIDTDDDPKSLPKDSKRVANAWGVKRGKWN